MAVELEFDYEAATKCVDCYSETSIRELKDWTLTLDKSTLVPKNLTNKQLLLFYNACKGDMEKTKTCVKKYYLYKKNAPEFFNERVFSRADLKQAAEVVELFYLPGTTFDGNEIIYYKLHNTDYRKYDLVTSCKLFFMVADLNLSKRGPKNGYICIFDMKGFGFRHVTKFNLTAVRKGFQFLQDAMLLRLKAIHIINTEYVVHMLMAIFKPFLYREFYDMFKLHSKSESLEKLYEIVPKTSLPVEYGGTQPDTQTLHKQSLEELMELEPYFKAEEDQRNAAILSNEEPKANLRGDLKAFDID